MTKKWGRIFKYNPKSTNNNNDDEDDNNKQFDYIKTLKYTTDKINKQMTNGTFTRREGFERWVISLHGDRELLELMVLSHYKV